MRWLTCRLIISLCFLEMLSCVPFSGRTGKIHRILLAWCEPPPPPLWSAANHRQSEQAAVAAHTAGAQWAIFTEDFSSRPESCAQRGKLVLICHHTVWWLVADLWGNFCTFWFRNFTYDSRRWGQLVVFLGETSFWFCCCGVEVRLISHLLVKIVKNINAK